MGIKSLGLSMAVGAAVGAVAVMMMPNNNAVRKLASKAADTVEDAAAKAGSKVSGMIEQM